MTCCSSILTSIKIIDWFFSSKTYKKIITFCQIALKSPPPSIWKHRITNYPKFFKKQKPHCPAAAKPQSPQPVPSAQTAWYILWMPICQWDPAEFAQYPQSHSYCWWKKSCTTWDGIKPYKYNGIIIILGGAGFCPSTVVRPKFSISSGFWCHVHVTKTSIHIHLFIKWFHGSPVLKKMVKSTTPYHLWCIYLHFGYFFHGKM